MSKPGTTPEKKPVILVMGRYDNDIWAYRAYKEFGVDEDGMPKYISNWRNNVTDQAIHLVFKHLERCVDESCLCQSYDFSSARPIHPTQG